MFETTLLLLIKTRKNVDLHMLNSKLWIPLFLFFNRIASRFQKWGNWKFVIM